MKKSKWALLIMIVMAVSLLTACKKEGDEVAVKIDDEKISINKFNNYTTCSPA